MACTVTVELGPRSYDIRVGERLLGDLGPVCKALGLAADCLVVTDSNVENLYGKKACKALSAAGFNPTLAVIPAGEVSKSQRFLFELFDKAVEAGLDRRSFLVALGGGVVGDLAGFAAATYLRGIRVIQVPTTLLAMVDSSVGGKTGINLLQGKNLVGAFHQPSVVLADIQTLASLPKREYVSGIAEVVKYGVIRDAAFFADLEDHVQQLLAGDAAVLERVVARCCEIKAEVVRLDEREGGLRAILNFGHTVGHAIEQVTEYSRYLHGEAVSIGMVFAARLSAQVRGFGAPDGARLMALLKAFGLPVNAPECSWTDLRLAMAVDKKGVEGVPRFVLVEKIGAVVTGCEVAEDVLHDVWEREVRRVSS